MRNDTRRLYTAYLAQLAALHGVDSATEKFTAEPSVAQKLETRIQESSAFLQRINMVGVREQAGEKIGLGISGPVASTTDTATKDRQTRDLTVLDNLGYLCTQTNFDNQDRLRLSNIQSTENKAALKRELLPAYAPYVEGVLSAGQGAQDDVLVTVMLWRIDAGDYPGALEVAAYVLKHGLAMPDRFERTTGCLIAEEIAEAARKAHKVGEPFDLDILHRTAELTAEQDMPDEVRAKLCMALGRATLAGLDQANPGKPGQIAAGIDLLTRAIELHDHCGAKTDKKAAEVLLKKLAPTG
ncbi:phage terminase small subunit [Pseudomonas knackmussii]|uniref:phage terminase small subunit n=1 Tax=Pseudomonas knackmussii TaxID=65741 RepID=UPI003F4A200F